MVDVKKSTIIIATSLIILSSCLQRKNTSICRDFNINIKDVAIKDTLFVSKLTKNLKNKLKLLQNKTAVNTCNIEMVFRQKDYSTIIDESGYTGRKNFKLELDYTINIANLKSAERKEILVFYGANISDNYYSEYIYNQKRQNNDLSILTEKLFYYILEDLKNIK